MPHILKAMNGFLNVRDLPMEVHFESAFGDGCKDDTEAIQAALTVLRRADDFDPDKCLDMAGNSVPDLGAWKPYWAGLYFPAGVYRITKQLEMPYLQQVRIFGDGGRGGEMLGDPQTPVGLRTPVGTVIRQDRAHEPIFVFKSGDSFGVSIEHLGFAWLTQQTPPPGFTRGGNNHTSPGAVGVLFSGGGRLPGNRSDDYYHFRITDCTFTRGFRGIAVDDLYVPVPDGTIAFFGSQIERCTFHQMAGAAISLFNNWTRIIGMTGNSVRDVFIENYNRVEDVNGFPTTTYYSRNFEEQIRLLAQACCTLDGIDAEGSKTTVLSAIDCVLDVMNLYLEHVEMEGLYPKLIYFNTGRYSLRGMNLDGLIYALDDPNLGNTPSFSTIINGEGGADITISGVRAYPFASVLDRNGNPRPPRDRDPDAAGGFLPLNGEALLVAGTDATYRILDRPQLPVYAQTQRGQVTYQPPLGPALTKDYRAFSTYAGGEAAVVRTGTIKTVRSLNFGPILAGRVGTITVGTAGLVHDDPNVDALVVGARPGDVVQLGLPSTLPAGLLASAVVKAAGRVEVRLFNGTAGTVDPPAGLWTIEVTGGPDAGAPQETTQVSLLEPAHGSRRIPPVH